MIYIFKIVRSSGSVGCQCKGRWQKCPVYHFILYRFFFNATHFEANKNERENWERKEKDLETLTLLFIHIWIQNKSQFKRWYTRMEKHFSYIFTLKTNNIYFFIIIDIYSAFPEFEFESNFLIPLSTSIVYLIK